MNKTNYFRKLKMFTQLLTIQERSTCRGEPFSEKIVGVKIFFKTYISKNSLYFRFSEKVPSANYNFVIKTWSCPQQ